MNFETSKTLGGIGAILVFISVFLSFGQFFAGPTVTFIGLILVLISLNSLANFYNSRAIFSNAIYGFIAVIIGVVSAVVVAFVVLLTSLEDFIYAVYPNWNGDWSSLQGITPDASNMDPSAIIPFLIGILLIFVVVWIFAIIAAFFIRRSLRELSIKSATGLFSTTGLLLLIGAVLIIAFGLGLILVWISALILAIAFFTLKPPPPETQTATAYPPTNA